MRADSDHGAAAAGHEDRTEGSPALSLQPLFEPF